jgi:hypothetical protein
MQKMQLVPFTMSRNQKCRSKICSHRSALQRNRDQKQYAFTVLLLSTFSPKTMPYCSEVPFTGAQLHPWGACPPELPQWLVGFSTIDDSQDCWRQFAFIVLLLVTFSPDSLQYCSGLPNSGVQVFPWGACPPELLL